MNKNWFLFLFRHPSNRSFRNESFSQEGEDIILDNLLNFKQDGFYIDLGAYKPVKYSNTFHFYLRGWNGINIDATPGSMRTFNKYRKRDINLEVAVSGSAGEMTYYQFNEPALNSFSADVVPECIKSGFALVSKKTISVQPIMKILDEYVPEGQDIDFIDIDIEGMDDIIVESIDWEKYHPTIVLVEKKVDNRSNALVSNAVLNNAGYLLVACTGRTAIYMDKRKKL